MSVMCGGVGRCLVHLTLILFSFKSFLTYSYCSLSISVVIKFSGLVVDVFALVILCNITDLKVYISAKRLQFPASLGVYRSHRRRVALILKSATS